MSHTYTDEQVAIFETLKTGSGDLIIDALAGSAKTYTLINELPVIPQKTVTYADYIPKMYYICPSEIKL